MDDPRLAHPEAVLVNRGREVRAFFEPLLEFARYLPAVAFVPMVLLWTGIGAERSRCTATIDRPRDARRSVHCASSMMWDVRRHVKMNSGTQKKPFSMIREFHLADWFTLGNAICGTAALFSTITYVQTESIRHIYFAGALVLAALIFDVADGRVARWRQTSSALGRELDSLADVISFGVTPAIIGYGCGMQGLYDRIILGYFVACGVSRLARYNVTAEQLSGGTGKVKYFEGTPIPSSIVLVGVLMAAACLGDVGEYLWFGEVPVFGHVLHPLSLMFGLSGSLMVSRIRIPKI